MNKDKKQFDYNNKEYIITEYLGIDKDTFKEFFDTSIFNDINNIINDYKEDKRNIEYMLESDFRVGYASDNFTYSNDITKMYKDIKFIKNVNGIIVYEEK